MEGAARVSRQSAGGRRQARRHLQGPGAEPEPVHLRRRRLGLEGTFVNGSFSTANFLGLGETVGPYRCRRGSAPATTSSRSPSRTSWIAPSLPASTSFCAVSPTTARRTSSATRSRTRGSRSRAASRVGRFARLFGSYGYQIVDIYGVDQKQLAALGLSSASYLQKGRRYESRLTPILGSQHRRQPVHAASRTRSKP